VEESHGRLTPLDELYLERAYELAGRGIGNTSPNPPVGAVVVRDGRLVGEGYHHHAGAAHAEANALAQAGSKARGATVYVSLEPCRHVGRTPPCTCALIEAGVARVVAGTVDPTEHGGGVDDLRTRGIDVTVANDPIARDLIEIFARATAGDRPYVALKMATSLDGLIASGGGVQERIGSEAEARYVRDLRAAFDAVMVGAGTVRIDDPQLTVRPPRDRLRPYTRVVACQSDVVATRSRVFASAEGYAKTIVLVPAGLRDRFTELRELAEVIEVGAPDAVELDLPLAMKALRARDLFSILCEGGPRLGAALLAAGQVDRIYWAIAPRFLSNEAAVPALSGFDLTGVHVNFDRVERVGPDVILSGTVVSSPPPPVSS
jgi:diaminohydroxyphosphoribosylaminopyrimidine deaminase / 5-amino-6-(5-phosphoribosylamino)uracil reductase